MFISRSNQFRRVFWEVIVRKHYSDESTRSERRGAEEEAFSTTLAAGQAQHPRVLGGWRWRSRAPLNRGWKAAFTPPALGQCRDGFASLQGSRVLASSSDSGLSDMRVISLLVNSHRSIGRRN